MSAPSLKVLVVDDEPPIRKLLRMGLSAHGYQVIDAPNGKVALELISQKPDLIILDLGLPDIQGLDLLRKMREQNEGVPIVVLSSRADEAAKVEALDFGADDYVTKPFALRELMSRIRALLRRAYGDLSNAAGGRVIRHGDLVIDLERRRVQRGNRRIGLTATEFEILRHLASRPGRVFTRRELLELLRDYEALDQDEKTINVHVSHLRDKIEDDPSLPQFVLTVRGAGYQFAER
jgi:two-component system KDP operon response regulator KdpE